ncbi:MAG: MATE family efflux transporter [Oscillospiraceae bacterium]|nr:MATE family efflux transporter [Oscillospiraceae bacterium]
MDHELNESPQRGKGFYRQISALTAPIVLQNILSVAVNSADVVMLNFVGQSHISAVSLAAQYASILFMVFYGLGTGATMLCSQYYGKGDMRAIDMVEGVALRFSVIAGAAFSLSALTFPAAMMRVFTPDAELIAIGAQYLRRIAPAYFFWSIIEIYLSVLRSIGRVRIATALNMFAFALNIALNAVFIFGLFGAPKLGASGVALATSISRFSELVLVFAVSARSHDVKLRFSYMFLKNDLLFRDFIRMAVPALANDVIWGLGFSMYSVIIGQYLGTDMVAANSFASLVRNIGSVFAFGIASGGSILVGQLIGEKRMEDADRAASEVVKLTVLFGAVGGFIVFAVSPLVLRFADITEAGRGYLRVMLWINTYYIMGGAVNTTLIAGVFRAGGDSRFGFVCDTVDMWCYAVPLGFFAAAVLKLPPLWVYFLLCTDEFVKWPWVFKHYRSKKWLRNITRDDLRIEGG